jgi:outer membrane lipoprotein SlyB
MMFLIALPLLASTNDNWEIIRADYGFGNNRADVTDRVLSLVRGDTLDFQVNGDSLGNSNQRGRNRVLRIEVRDRDGNSRELTYRDRQQVNFRVIRSNRAGIGISRATYGSNRDSRDVTALLNSQVRNGQLNLQVNNQTMGGDPAPGQAKSLNVEYLRNGEIQRKFVREGDNLQLSLDTYSANSGYNDNGRYNDGRNSGYNDGREANGNNGYNSDNRFTRRVTCESNNYKRQYCTFDTRSGVRLVRVVGDSQCDKGSSWDYDKSGIWVDRGCRAEFESQGNNYNGYGTSSGLPSTTLPSGTEFSVRTNEAIDSKSASIGQRFSAQIAADILDNNGAVRIPKGSDAQLVIRTNGDSDSNLVLDIDTVSISGTQYAVSTGDLTEKGGEGLGANKKTGVMVGGGAAVGTLIGALIGGGKGAAIGAVVGAGAGAGGVVLTKGKEVKVPSETLLNFRLDQDLRLQAVR